MKEESRIRERRMRKEKERGGRVGVVLGDTGSGYLKIPAGEEEESWAG